MIPQATDTRVRIDPNLSDLFFNTDVESAILRNGRDFDGYDDEKMLEEAESFLACIERLGVSVPSPRDLVDDFYSRV